MPGEEIQVLQKQDEKADEDAAGTKDPVSLRDALQGTYVKMAQSVQREGIIGIASGFSELDALVSGFQKGQLIAVAGWPGIGKTSFALNIMQHAGLHAKAHSLIFSPGMKADELCVRLLGAHADVAMRSENGRMAREDSVKVTCSMRALSPIPVWIDDTADISVADMKERAFAIRDAEGLDMIFVDYLQLVRPPEGSKGRFEAFSEITRQLKVLAMELNVPVMLLTQLARPDEPRKAPRLADLQDAGTVEENADVIILLQRSNYEGGTIRLDVSSFIVAKQRNGPTGTVHVKWDPATMSFRQMSISTGKKDKS